MLVVTLYTKADCSLCDDAHNTLRGLQEHFQFLVEEVDITTSESTFAAYRFRIPVVQFGRVELAAPIDPRELEQALRSAITAQ